MTRTVLDKEARRQQLVDAAIDVFASKGYRIASVSDIIEKAGVARGTFYLYFESKEEAFRAVLERFKQLHAAMATTELARDYTNPVALGLTLRQTLRDWLHFLFRNKQLTKVVFRQAAAIDPAYEQLYQTIVKDTRSHWTLSILHLQKSGFLRSDLDPFFLSTVLVGGTIQSILEAAETNTQPDLETIADQWIKLLRGGVLNPNWMLRASHKDPAPQP